MSKYLLLFAAFLCFCVFLLAVIPTVIGLGAYLCLLDLLDAFLMECKK